VPHLRFLVGARLAVPVGASSAAPEDGCRRMCRRLCALCARGGEMLVPMGRFAQYRSGPRPPRSLRLGGNLFKPAHPLSSRTCSIHETTVAKPQLLETKHQPHFCSIQNRMFYDEGALVCANVPRKIRV
jgi:hypothetical protein